MEVGQLPSSNSLQILHSSSDGKIRGAKIQGGPWLQVSSAPRKTMN
jgi:hypothetical protein